jgi:hypothetical protein
LYDLLKGEDLSEDDSDEDGNSVLREEFQRNFALKSDHDKLRILAQRTQDLYKKAIAFDAKMVELNKQYDFLDKGMKYESKRLTEAPNIPNGLIDPGSH